MGSVELLPKRVIVLALHPGTVNTELSAPFLKSASKRYKIFSPAESAANLLDIVDRATLDDSGRSLAWPSPLALRLPSSRVLLVSHVSWPSRSHHYIAHGLALSKCKGDYRDAMLFQNVRVMTEMRPESINRCSVGLQCWFVLADI